MSRHSMDDRRWWRVCKDIKDRDGYACVQCGETEDLTVDHVYPLDLFTDDDWMNERQYDPTNLLTLCRPCNSRKGNRTTVRITWLSTRWFSGWRGVRPPHSTFSQNQPKTFENEEGTLI